MVDEIDDFYVEEYNQAFSELKDQVSKEDYDQIMEELVANHNVKRSEDGRVDAQQNFISAMDAVRGSGGFDEDTKNFLNYIAKTDRKSKGEVHAWARKALSKGIKPRHRRR